MNVSGSTPLLLLPLWWSPLAVCIVEKTTTILRTEHEPQQIFTNPLPVFRYAVVSAPAQLETSHVRPLTHPKPRQGAHINHDHIIFHQLSEATDDSVLLACYSLRKCRLHPLSIGTLPISSPSTRSWGNGPTRRESPRCEVSRRMHHDHGTKPDTTHSTVPRSATTVKFSLVTPWSRGGSFVITATTKTKQIRPFLHTSTSHTSRTNTQHFHGVRTSPPLTPRILIREPARGHNKFTYFYGPTN